MAVKCSSAMVAPIFEYSHNATVPGTSVSTCNSITGGAFVPNGVWPGYDGAYLFSDYVCGAIFKLTNSGDTPLTFTVTTAKTTAITLSKSSGSIDPAGNVTVPFTITCSAFFADYTISVASNGGTGTVTIHYTS